MPPAEIPIIVVAPSLANQRVDLNAIATEFGWRVGDGREDDTVAVAVLCDLGDDPLKALDVATDQYPFAKIVGCARFSANIDFDALTGRGLYHLLYTPIDSAELRQSLGFLASAMEIETQLSSRKTRWSPECVEAANESHKPRKTRSRDCRSIVANRDLRARHA